MQLKSFQRFVLCFHYLCLNQLLLCVQTSSVLIKFVYYLGVFKEKLQQAHTSSARIQAESQPVQQTSNNKVQNQTINSSFADSERKHQQQHQAFQQSVKLDQSQKINVIGPTVVKSEVAQQNLSGQQANESELIQAKKFYSSSSSSSSGQQQSQQLSLQAKREQQQSAHQQKQGQAKSLSTWQANLASQLALPEDFTPELISQLASEGYDVIAATSRKSRSRAIQQQVRYSSMSSITYHT